MVSKNWQHFDFKNFLIRCILDYAQPHLVDFWKKRPANFNFIWLEWNSYNSSIQIHIVWSRSSIFKLKSSPAQGCFCILEGPLVHWLSNDLKFLFNVAKTYSEQILNISGWYLDPFETLQLIIWKYLVTVGLLL